VTVRGAVFTVKEEVSNHGAVGFTVLYCSEYPVVILLTNKLLVATVPEVTVLINVFFSFPAMGLRNLMSTPVETRSVMRLLQ
jgi:hypothetical protein